jgi:hypothetical protein
VTLPGVDVRRRIDGIIRVLHFQPKGKRTMRLFWAACAFREIMEEGKLSRKAAVMFLMSAAHGNRMLADKGRDRCMRTILDGFRHVEEKLEDWRQRGSPR